MGAKQSYAIKYEGLEKLKQCLSDKVITKDVDILVRVIDNFLWSYNNPKMFGDISKQEERINFYKEIEPYFALVDFDIIELKDADKEPFESLCEVKINKDDNRMIVLETLGSGSYGEVINARVNGCDVAVKTAIKSKVKYTANSLVEGMIHVLLQCSKDNIESQIDPDSGWEWPFPQLDFLLKSVYGPKNNQVFMIGMEKLSESVYTLFREMDIPTVYVNDIFIQLIVYLFWLQKTTGFVHRDLHGGNVMVQIRPKIIEKTYTIGDDSITLDSYYRVFIIDYGQICIDLSDCHMCHIDAQMQPSASSYGLDEDNVKCDFSYDTRMFFGMLYDKFDDDLSEENKILNYFGKRSWEGLEKAKGWHSLYKLVNTTNESFLPQNMFATIVSKGLAN